MRTLILIVTFILFAQLVSAQDKIIQKNGKKIYCEITSVDSTDIYLNFTKNNVKSSTFIHLSEVSAYTMNGKTIYTEEFHAPEVRDSSFYTSEIPESATPSADSIEASGRYLVYLFSDEIIYGDIVEYDKPFMGMGRVYVDSKKYQAPKIKFYKNETGFYANTKNLNFWSTNSFTERIVGGKVNLYQTETWRYVPGGYSPTGFYTGGYTYKDIDNYYNKGFGDLRRANYKNLSHELSDNARSMEFMKKYKNLQYTQLALCLAGTFAIVGGLTAMINKTDTGDDPYAPEPSVGGELLIMSTGFVCFGVNYIISLNKPKQLQKAVFEYNNN